jgi:hypothetical protein
VKRVTLSIHATHLRGNASAYGCLADGPIVLARASIEAPIAKRAAVELIDRALRKAAKHRGWVVVREKRGAAK